jgi:hypothetical protein
LDHGIRFAACEVKNIEFLNEHSSLLRELARLRELSLEQSFDIAERLCCSIFARL